MEAKERIYRRTEAGRQAWASESSGLPPPLRRILAVVEGDTHFAVIRSGMMNCTEYQLLQWLQQLQTLHFLASDSAGAEFDLDFLPARHA